MHRPRCALMTLILMGGLSVKKASSVDLDEEADTDHIVHHAFDDKPARRRVLLGCTAEHFRV